ncbi:hypothetical protein DFH09DRAFT_1170601, partial [Mycena vulgaris]
MMSSVLALVLRSLIYSESAYNAAVRFVSGPNIVLLKESRHQEYAGVWRAVTTQCSTCAPTSSTCEMRRLALELWNSFLG